MRYIINQMFTVTHKQPSTALHYPIKSNKIIEGFTAGSTIQIHYIQRGADGKVEYQFRTTDDNIITKVFPSTAAADSFIAALCGEEKLLQEQRALADI